MLNLFTGALGQQTQFLLPLVSQNQQSQNASVFTLRSQKASVSEQAQIQSRQRNFRKNLLASIYGHRQQSQILKRTSPVSHMVGMIIYR